MLAARPRLDAHARELEKWLGHLGHRRIFDGRNEEQRIAGGAHQRSRWGRGVQNVEDCLRRAVVARGTDGARSGGRRRRRGDKADERGQELETERRSSKGHRGGQPIPAS